MDRVFRRVLLNYYVLLSLSGGFVLFSLAPDYLDYENLPIRSNAIVLLVGGDNTAKKHKVQELNNQGYSQYIIIPAYGEVYKDSEDGKLALIQKSGFMHERMNKNIKVMNHKFYENTHLEMLQTKSMMDAAHFRSAIFVSEPYHMRRIKLIAERVFDQKNYHLVFIPTSSDNKNQVFWWLDKDKRRWIVSEYLKIFWFILYEPFSLWEC